MSPVCCESAKYHGRGVCMNLPVHRRRFSGNDKGTRSVWVSGNYRVTFNIEAQDAADVDYLDHYSIVGGEQS